MQKRKPRYRMPQIQSINSQARYKRRTKVNQSDLALSFTWNVEGCHRVSEFQACVVVQLKQRTKTKRQCQTPTSEKKGKD